LDCVVEVAVTQGVDAAGKDCFEVGTMVAGDRGIPIGAVVLDTGERFGGVHGDEFGDAGIAAIEKNDLLGNRAARGLHMGNGARAEIEHVLAEGSDAAFEVRELREQVERGGAKTHAHGPADDGVAAGLAEQSRKIVRDERPAALHAGVGQAAFAGAGLAAKHDAAAVTRDATRVDDGDVEIVEREIGHGFEEVIAEIGRFGDGGCDTRKAIAGGDIADGEVRAVGGDGEEILLRAVDGLAAGDGAIEMGDDADFDGRAVEGLGPARPALLCGIQHGCGVGRDLDGEAEGVELRAMGERGALHELIVRMHGPAHS